MTDLVGRKNVAVWDDHRNTSRVFDVPPEAVDEAAAALARFRRDDPALVAWIEAGAPRLTDAEHRARFGAPYAGHRSGPARNEYEPTVQATLDV